MRSFIFAFLFLVSTPAFAKPKFVEIAAGGKLEFSPSVKVLLKGEQQLPDEKVGLKLRTSLAEVGSYQVGDEKYRLLTSLAVVENEEELGVANEYLVQRFLLSKQELIELSSSRIAMLDKTDPKKVIESALLRHLKMQIVKVSKLELKSLSKVPRVIVFKPADLKLENVEFNSQNNLTAAKFEKAKLFYVPGSPAYYFKTEDGLLAKYGMGITLDFTHGNSKYQCNQYAKREIGAAVMAKPGAEITVTDFSHPIAGKVYRPAKADVIREFIKMYEDSYESSRHELKRRNEEYPSQKAEMPKKLTVKEIAELNPVVYLKDEADRVYECKYKSLYEEIIPTWAEPLVYFYPQREAIISYAIHPSIRLSAADPQGQGNFWYFKAQPNGDLDFSNERLKRRYLFWEGRGDIFPSLPTAGVLLPAPEVEGFLIDQLEKFGFSQKESEDFRAYWVPILKQAPYALIDFLIQSEVDAYAPIEVSNPITQGIRVYINHRPLKSPNISYKKKVFPVIERPKSNFFVEWGGVVWGKGIRFL